MAYSYKPVLMKAVIELADKRGMVPLDGVTAYFRAFYDDRRKRGLVVEKPRSIYNDPNVSNRDILRNILSNPFKRFETMSMMKHTRNLGIIQVDTSVWKKLTDDDKQSIIDICERKLNEYYDRIGMADE